MNIEDRQFRNGYIVGTLVDSNKEEGEVFSLDNVQLSQSTFAFLLVVNADPITGIKKGETVLYRKSGATSLRHKGQNYVLIKSESVVAL